MGFALDLLELRFFLQKDNISQQARVCEFERAHFRPADPGRAIPARIFVHDDHLETETHARLELCGDVRVVVEGFDDPLARRHTILSRPRELGLRFLDVAAIQIRILVLHSIRPFTWDADVLQRGQFGGRCLCICDFSAAVPAFHVNLEGIVRPRIASVRDGRVVFNAYRQVEHIILWVVADAERSAQVIADAQIRVVDIRRAIDAPVREDGILRQAIRPLFEIAINRDVRQRDSIGRVSAVMSPECLSAAKAHCNDDRLHEIASSEMAGAKDV